MNVLETIDGEKYVHVGTLQHVLRGFIGECEDNMASHIDNPRELDALMAAAMTGITLHDNLTNMIVDSEFSIITEGIFDGRS